MVIFQFPSYFKCYHRAGIRVNTLVFCNYLSMLVYGRRRQKYIQHTLSIIANAPSIIKFVNFLKNEMLILSSMKGALKID